MSLVNPTPALSLIYARSLNHCIGHAGKIPWHLPDEFAHFQRTTMGKSIIMGRRTYEDHCCELPGRHNIVVSTQKGYCVAEGVELAQSLKEAIELGRKCSDEVFIIGGVGMFSQAMVDADTVYETIVDTHIEGDTILPAFDFSDWNTQVLARHSIDAQHLFAYTVYLHRK